MGQEIPKCYRCGSDLKKHPEKDYWCCPNWKPPGQNGCEGTIFWPEGTRKRTYPNVVISYKVESKSHPGHFHQVKVFESEDLSCPCEAGEMGRFCRHKKIMVKEVAQIINNIINKYKDRVPVKTKPQGERPQVTERRVIRPSDFDGPNLQQ